MALWEKSSPFCSDICIICYRINNGGDWVFQLVAMAEVDVGVKDDGLIG